jgi:hypothetical protein
MILDAVKAKFTLEHAVNTEISIGVALLFL